MENAMILSAYTLCAMLGLVQNIHSSECSYLPVETIERPYPELEVFSDCGSIENGVLRLEESHNKNLDFNENNLAVVFMSNRVFYVHETGAVLETLAVDNAADSFSEGLVRIIVESKFGFADRSLTVVIPARYDFAFPFEKNLAIVCNECFLQADGEHYKVTGGSWGVINSKGEIIVPVKYARDAVFEKE